MNNSLMPQSSVALARRVVRSWINGSNTILVSPPLTDATSLFDLLSDRKFHIESGVDSGLLSIARFRAGRIESPQTFINGVVAQWDPTGLIQCEGNDIGGDLRKVLKAVYDSGRIPVLIIEAFHQAVRTLTWDVGTALRDLEHNLKLRTVVELPVKLSTLRSRWAVENNKHDFLASEFGQGHSTLTLTGYTQSEVEAAVATHKLNKVFFLKILDLSGGIPDLMNWLIREAEYCEGLDELTKVAHNGAADICYRFFKWLDARGEKSFTRTLAKMYNNESLATVFARIDFHEWSNMLLTEGGELRSQLVGYSASQQILLDSTLSTDGCPKVSSEADCTGLTEPATKKEIIVVAATCWGVLHGGINSFNLDFCVSLTHDTKQKYEVICLVPTNADIVEEADGVDVRYIRVEGGSQFFGFDVSLAREILRDAGEIRFVLGHDLITGDFCCNLAMEFGAKSIVFCHMSYAAYYSMMNSSEQSSHKVEGQRRLLAKADVVFAVGPKLAKHAQALLRISTSRAQVYEYIPNLLNLHPARSPRGIPCITYVGRLGQGSELVKQGLLAVSAIGVAIKELRLRDPVVRFIGSADAQDEAHYKKLINDGAGKLVSTEFLPFRNSRLDTLTHIMDSSLIVMPSVHDGFGLVGWEAISLGIPLVISQNTGVYEYLTELGLQNYVGSVDVLGSMDTPREDDVKSLSEQLVVKLRDFEKAHDDAATLLARIKNLNLNSVESFTASMKMAFN
ncbi:glycosyltransferase family 4 protein [Pseudomonas tremae]|uniref:glycosyltransferase family 4 protein n=1 Tax=Pseudomonas tremae TaxID=200454 RepID=UPI001F391ACE|nr:glycosyltransferase family 4 protein [Pseudomonas tremae]MCF5747818.1 glycosyltransferase [Pseudomonas tremae]UQB36525.1 glycosyltransferase family 4 protein [Pseudomonas tremae]